MRVEYEGAIYHVMNRGDRQEPIFTDDHDAQEFVNGVVGSRLHMQHLNLNCSQILRTVLISTSPQGFFNRFAKLSRQHDITLEPS